MTYGELREVLAADFAVNTSIWNKTVVAVFRLGQYAAAKRSRIVARLVWRVLDTILLRLCLNAELYPSVKCGPGLRIEHAAQGVVLHPRVVLGDRARIFHRVTIGVAGGNDVPVIGDDVMFGVGACVLGGITVGDGVIIGPAAVVTRDVPAGARVTAASPRVSEPAA